MHVITKDWYLPSLNELSILYSGKGAIGNFDTSGGWYWSSTEPTGSYNYLSAWIQRFSDGTQNFTSGVKNYAYFVRCVRR